MAFFLAKVFVLYAVLSAFIRDGNVAFIYSVMFVIFGDLYELSAV